MHKEEMHKEKHPKRKLNYRRIMFALVIAALGTFMFALPIFADTVSASGMMMNLISLMCSMFKYVGAAIFVWAIIQFILATKRSDADSKSDAVQTAVCGIALMAIAVFVKNLGLADAIGGSSDSVTDDVLDNAN